MELQHTVNKNSSCTLYADVFRLAILYDLLNIK